MHFLHEYRAQGKYRLHEFVVMPDHFHVLVTIGAEISIEKAVQFIKGRFAFEAGCRLGFMAPVWQKGFSEVRIVNGDQYDGVAEYIRNNPVVAHLVEKAEDYRYSSAYPGVELDPAPQGLKPCSLSLAVRHG